ncbi:MAG: AmmeMemoRadiSam system protein B [Bacillati bacterium ANGP1]|uniref:AmmeMemoRadiSam system protein B n=1 Tax=Candidatus Segetimicrobium genomatis TaxID=2569760 RepID=A0A537K215_9BACT|nr:MAG: AmmeMemoRadiSam system protein B [Terrabacteria group bacterium ANGP1]
MPVPKLRPLDLVAGEWQGRRAVYARDYEGLLESPVLLPLPVFLVALLLDGRREIIEVQGEYARLTGGTILPRGDLDRIIQDLDAHHLLETPRLAQRRRDVEQAYRAAPHRAPAHAGVSYPADPAALAATLEGFLSAAAIGRPGGDGDPAPARRPRGLLAPHIDFLRGGPTYGRAYGAVGEIPAGTCAVVVGVAHAGPPAPYVLTTKGYATPGRVIEVDRPLLDAVASRYPFDAMTHEAVHRTEHSIEFQVLFLDHLAGGRPLTILPVLCSSFEPLCGRASPSQLGEVESFIAALRDAIAEAERPVIVVGGVDLSHVGPRFGDAEAVGPTLAAAARADDLAALDRAVAGDAEGFWQTVMADGNRRRVCGLSAIYTVLRLLTPTRGHLLAYNQGEDPAGGMVGFAAAVFGEVRADDGACAGSDG